MVNQVVNDSGEQLDAIFAALADTTRRGILTQLARSGTATVGELAEPYPISAPAISKHIRVLEEAGLIEREVDGRVHRCRLTTARLEEVSRWIDRTRRFWESQFRNLDARAPAGGAPRVAQERLDFDSDKARLVRARMKGRQHHMKMIDPILMELDQEASTTRKLLERVPANQLGWRPHAKSRTLGALANHIAVAQARVANAIQTATYDLSNREAPAPDSLEGILENFDASTAEARRLLASMSDEDLMSMWEGQAGGRTVFKSPKIGVIRAIVMNHIIHHRGQLTVYLRQLDVPLPSVYGPTADENPFM
jgi:DNA-binding transcriptional ArsR family regulator/uncharacterized damage-inducible protein DinB